MAALTTATIVNIDIHPVVTGIPAASSTPGSVRSTHCCFVCLEEGPKVSVSKGHCGNRNISNDNDNVNDNDNSNDNVNSNDNSNVNSNDNSNDNEEEVFVPLEHPGCRCKTARVHPCCLVALTASQFKGKDQGERPHHQDEQYHYHYHHHHHYHRHQGEAIPEFGPDGMWRCATCKHPFDGAARLALARADYERFRPRFHPRTTEKDSNRNSNSNSNSNKENSNKDNSNKDNSNSDTTKDKERQHRWFLAQFHYAKALSECSDSFEDHSRALEIANHLTDVSLLQNGGTHNETLRVYTLFATCHVLVGSASASASASERQAKAVTKGRSRALAASACASACARASTLDPTRHRAMRIYRRVLDAWNRKRLSQTDSISARSSASTTASATATASAIATDATLREADREAVRTTILLANLHCAGDRDRDRDRRSEALALAREALAVAESSGDDALITEAHRCIGGIVASDLLAGSENDEHEQEQEHEHEHEHETAHDASGSGSGSGTEDWQCLAESHLDTAANGFFALYGGDHPATIDSVRAFRAVSRLRLRASR